MGIPVLIPVKLWFLVTMMPYGDGTHYPEVQGRYTTKEECVANMPENLDSTCLFGNYHLYDYELEEYGLEN